MEAIWSVSRALQIPLDKKIKELPDIPFTISYVIRKRQQIDNLMELPKDKRPPDDILWEGSSEDMEEWLDRVITKREPTENVFVIDNVEGQ